MPILNWCGSSQHRQTARTGESSASEGVKWNRTQQPTLDVFGGSVDDALCLAGLKFRGAKSVPQALQVEVVMGVAMLRMILSAQLKFFNVKALLESMSEIQGR